jgi:uncharacterized protein YijF (DUF1287 family)
VAIGQQLGIRKTEKRMPNRRSFVSGISMFLAMPAVAQPRPAALLQAARKQVGVTLHYDPLYTRMSFPGGDVGRERGVCCDVVIRAYRDAFGLDLQALVHADMRQAFGSYPPLWGLRQPDSNIDHRRVPNLESFLQRQGARKSIPQNGFDWEPGDIFTSRIGGRLPHIGFVSDRKGTRSWMVVHNIGAGAREEDALLDYPLAGRFRWKVSGLL